MRLTVVRSHMARGRSRRPDLPPRRRRVEERCTRVPGQHARSAAMKSRLRLYHGRRGPRGPRAPGWIPPRSCKLRGSPATYHLGPDYGVDILAGCGPLGLDSPTLVVELKSESTDRVPILNQLKGALSTHGANQALLVAWGGLIKQAEELRRTQRLSIQVWTAEDLLDRLFNVYERLR
jgi:hypothetical protein